MRSIKKRKLRKNKEQPIFYICDRRKCEVCRDECTHTIDITHARNFKKEYDMFFELTNKEKAEIFR